MKVKMKEADTYILLLLFIEMKLAITPGTAIVISWKSSKYSRDYQPGWERCGGLHFEPIQANYDVPCANYENINLEGKREKKCGS